MSECNLCGSERVCALSEVQEIRYKSYRLEVELAYSVCEACGREFVTTEQIRKNDHAILAAKRHADGLMSPKEIRRAREVLGLTQHKAAELFGGGRNAFSKYERGEVAQSGAMDRLIRLCLARPELLLNLAEGYLDQRVIHTKKEAIAVQDWQYSEDPVNDAVYHSANTPLRSLTVVPEQDVAYGS